MIDEIDRRTLMGADSEDAGDRRQPLFWLLWALLIFFVLFGCGQTAMWFDSGGLEDVEIRSGLTVDYGIWTPVAFGGINPLIIAEAAGDNGGVVFLASNPSDSCFLLGCTPNPPTPTATPMNTPTVTSIPTSTPTPTNTPTATNTWIPTFTPTATDTPTITPTPTNTPTPTPRVYPVKIAYPYKIPPGPTPVTIDYEVMVINWGSIPPAELTLICDFLPADMTYVSGSANQGGIFGSCPDPDGILTGSAIYWVFSPPLVIPQGGFTLPSFTFQANAQNTIAGQVLINEVHTWGDNIETAVVYRPVYVFTPTPTSTPVGAPTANNDNYSMNEDTPLVVSNPNSSAPVGGVLGNDVDLLWNGTPDVLTAQVISGPSSGTLNLNPDGTFTFTPELNTNGLVAFSYRACDAGSLCADADVEIDVISIPDVPVAIDDVYTVGEDSVLSIPGPLGTEVSNNDTDGDGDPLTVDPTPVIPPTQFLTLNDTGAFYYDPGGIFNGFDTFTYRVCDSSPCSSSIVSSDTAIVTINVTPLNDAPVLDNLGSMYLTTLDEDEVNSGGDLVSGIIASAGGDRITDVDIGAVEGIAVISVIDTNGEWQYDVGGGWTAFGSVTNNSAVLLADTALIRFVPDLDYNGGSIISFRAWDQTSGSNGDTGVNVSVNGGITSFSTGVEIAPIVITSINDFPMPQDDSATTNEDLAITIDVLANDWMGNNPPPAPGDGMGSVVVTSGPANGTTVVNGDYTITYTPDSNYFSPIGPPVDPDTFIYSLTDGNGDLDTATVTVTVNAVNDPPVAVDDPQAPALYELDEDNTLAVLVVDGVLTNDSDVESDPLTAVLDADVSDGTLTLYADGSFDYVPDPDFNGTDTFTYHANDGADDSNIATVTITVNPQNDTPAAVDDPVSTDEDVTAPIDVLANDWMGNNAPPAPGDGVGSLVVVPASGPSNGTATVNDNGTLADASDDWIDYVPNGDWSGVDTFDYEVCDVDGPPDCDTATVTVTVNTVNDPPVAVADPQVPTLYEVNEDDAIGLSIGAPGVLANDTDVEGDPLTAVLDADVSDGTLTLNANGSFQYDPDPDFNGTDTFTYHANDGADDSNIVTVTVTVISVNDTPAAVGDAVSTGEDTPITIDVLANDVLGDDPVIGDGVLSVVPLAGPTTVGTVAPVAGYQVLYASPLDWSGTDTFTYTVTDTNGDSSTATVTVTVNVVNDPPVAVDDPQAPIVYQLDEDDASGLSIAAPGVLGNDTDVDNPPGDLSAVLDADVSDGTLTLNGDGSFDYMPDPDFNGTDTFTYHANDGADDSNIATVSITVNPINDTPIAVDDGGPLFSVNEDVGLMMFFIPGVLGNDTGIGDTPLTLTVVAGPSDGGLLSLNNSGAFGYFPAADYFGITTFDYRVTDLDGEWSEATVTITVNEVNDPPIASDDDDGDGAFVDEDDSVTIDVLANDVDGDPLPISDTLSVQSVTDPPNGTAVTNVSDVTYTPDADFYGTDTFQYTVSDGRGGTDTATVTVRVDPVNDTPIAVDDGGPLFSVNEDVGLMMFFIPGVLGNDTGIGDTPLTLTVVAGPSDGGLLSLNNSGAFGYFPAADYFGTTTFDYRVTDLDGQWSEATVTITVSPVDDQPTANDDAVTTNEDVSVTIDVLANDPMGNNTPPAPGDGIGSVSVTVDPLNGTAIVNGDYSITYTPNGDWSGGNTFTYELCDGDPTPDCDTATVTVTVNAVNDPPVAIIDGPYNVGEDGTLAVPAVSGVLTNDTDVDNPPGDLSAVLDADVSDGTLTLYADGSFDYTPNADFNGNDTFTYHANDGVDDSNIATVTITVNSQNDTPAAVDDAVSTNEDTPITIDVLANDWMGNNAPPAPGDGMGSVVVTVDPLDGTAVVNGDFTVTYTPDSDYFSPLGVPDTFTYTVCDVDGLPDCDTKTVTVTVTAVNDPPVAIDDGPYYVDEDTLTPLAVAALGVLTNDYDVDGDPFSPTLVSNVSNGTLALGLDGSFTYMPNSNFNGTDMFTYEICDPSPVCSSANVTIVVNPVPDPQMFISVSPSDVTLNPNEIITFQLAFGNQGPGTAYGIVINGAVTGDCTLLTPNPIITSSSMNEGDGLLTTADVQENASGGACTFTATITSTNGTTANGSAEINKSTAMWAPFSSRAMASTGSDGTIEAAIAFLIPVAMLVTPFIISWWGKMKRTPRPR